MLGVLYSRPKRFMSAPISKMNEKVVNLRRITEETKFVDAGTNMSRVLRSTNSVQVIRFRGKSDFAKVGYHPGGGKVWYCWGDGLLLGLVK